MRAGQLVSNRISLATAAFLLTGVAACSDTQVGSKLSVEPRPQKLNSTQSVSLRLPHDATFNIALSSSSKQPGLEASADADARVDKSGQAEAHATVTGGGTALGSFQLGHAFANDTERQTDFAFKVTCRYRYEVHIEPDVNLPDASVGLWLYARDNRGRLLRSLQLAGHTTESGSAADGGDETTEFNLTLGPATTVSVFVAGQAQINQPAGERAARAAVTLESLQIELKSTPAPAVGTTTNAAR